MVEGLLIKDPKRRLGCGEDGVRSIQRMPFFESIEQAESFKSQGIAYTGKIAFVHVAGKAAAGAVEETGCERPPLLPLPHKN